MPESNILAQGAERPMYDSPLTPPIRPQPNPTWSPERTAFPGSKDPCAKSAWGTRGPGKC